MQEFRLGDHGRLCWAGKKALYERFDHLNDKEKGELIGYTIGRYGTDIFIGAGAIKGVAAYRDLKNANRLCNLEAMVISNTNKEKSLHIFKACWGEECLFQKCEI